MLNFRWVTFLLVAMLLRLSHIVNGTSNSRTFHKTHSGSTTKTARYAREGGGILGFLNVDLEIIKHIISIIMGI